jgi:RNA polymerase sigma factor (sigma-70 family)
VATAKHISPLENAKIPEYIRESDELYKSFAEMVVALVAEGEGSALEREPDGPVNNSKRKQQSGVKGTRRLNKFLADREAILHARADQMLWNRLNLDQQQALIVHYKLDDSDISSFSYYRETAGALGVSEKRAINTIYGAKTALKYLDPDIALGVQSSGVNRAVQRKYHARKNALADSSNALKGRGTETGELFEGWLEDAALGIGEEHNSLVKLESSADLQGVSAFWRYLIDIANTNFLGREEEDRRFLAVERAYEDIVVLIKNSVALSVLAGIRQNFTIAEFFHMLQSGVACELIGEDISENGEDMQNKNDTDIEDAEADTLTPKERNNRTPLLRALVSRASTTLGEAELEIEHGTLNKIGELLDYIEENQSAVALGNLPFVVYTAKRLHNLDYPMPLDEMVQWGNTGLMYAVRTYDPARVANIRTYAWHWINQRISHAISDTSMTIRQPAHIGESIGKIKKFADVRLNETSWFPSEQEIAQALGMSEQKVVGLLKTKRAAYALSLNRIVSDDGATELGDLLADRTIVPLDDSVATAQERTVLFQLLSMLPPRQVEILKRRFGLESGEGETLREIAQSMDISRQGVSNLEYAALAKLKQYAQDAGYSMDDFL